MWNLFSPQLAKWRRRYNKLIAQLWQGDHVMHAILRG